MSVEGIIGYVDDGKEATSAVRQCAAEVKSGIGNISVGSVIETINTLQAQLEHLLEGDGEGTLARIMGFSVESRSHAKTAIQQYGHVVSPGGNPLIQQARSEISTADARASRLAGYLSHSAQAVQGAIASLENSKIFLGTFEERQVAAKLMADGIIASCEASVVRADAYIEQIGS